MYNKPIAIDKKLAVKYGLKEAIVYQLFKDLILNAENEDIESQYVDGCWWITFGCYDVMSQEYLGFLSPSTVQRLVTSLEENHLIMARMLGKNFRDRSKWYALYDHDIAQAYVTDDSNTSRH